MSDLITGANEADVQSREANSGDATTKRANGLLREAARVIVPYGCEYVGSGAVHYFVNKASLLSEKHEYAVTTQACLGEAPEHFADVGWKELRKAFMGYYNRKTPRRVK